MAFVTKAVSSIADNWFGMDPPKPATPPAQNLSIATDTSNAARRNETIRGPSLERRRSDSLAVGGGGQSGLPIDPLGRRGGGYIAAHKSLLGR